MTRLSVNVNKIATLRIARVANNPNITELVTRIESFGAHGITVHPRPDERHITLNDVYAISKIVTKDYNTEEEKHYSTEKEISNFFLMCDKEENYFNQSKIFILNERLN